jgi:tetratricopeptide (TPR) repeat protein
MRTPILFLIFNRPDETAKVFEMIRSLRPEKLFVAADGPREKAGEAERCAAARKIACAVDWPCELQTLFHPENLGGKVAINTALAWFFAHESEGVVMEDSNADDLRAYGEAEVRILKMGVNLRAAQELVQEPVPEPVPESPWKLDLRDGFDFLAQGEFNQATIFFTRAAQDEPENPRIVMGLALAAMQEGNLDAALTLLAYALKLDAYNEDALLHYLALSKKMDKAKPATAREKIKETQARGLLEKVLQASRQASSGSLSRVERALAGNP